MDFWNLRWTPVPKRKQGSEKNKNKALIKSQRNLMITFWWKCEHWTRETSLQEQVSKRDTKDSTSDTQPAQREPRWEWPHQEQQLTVFYPSTRTHQQLQIIIMKWGESMQHHQIIYKANKQRLQYSKNNINPNKLLSNPNGVASFLQNQNQAHALNWCLAILRIDLPKCRLYTPVNRQIDSKPTFTHHIINNRICKTSSN